jgi:uncharacterized protein (UPF0276 family)
VTDWAWLGFGAGLRAEHYEDVLSGARDDQWFEAITENFIDTKGRPLRISGTSGLPHVR